MEVAIFTILLLIPNSSNLYFTIFRTSRPEVFCKKGVLRNFTKFTRKHLCLRPATLLKKRLWHRYFPVHFVKFLRTPFFMEHLWWLLLTISPYWTWALAGDKSMFFEGIFAICYTKLSCKVLQGYTVWQGYTWQVLHSLTRLYLCSCLDYILQSKSQKQSSGCVL